MQEEIMELKKTCHSLEKKMEKTGKGGCSSTIELSKMLQGLMADIELTQEKEKKMWNPAAITRLKLAKKGIKLGKELNYFEMWIAAELEKGAIPEDAGKRFRSISKLIKRGKMPAAKEEFKYFEGIIELGKAHETAKEKLKEHEKALRKEQIRIEKLLAEISSLESETIDQEKVRNYTALLENLEKLREARAAHIRSMLSKPVAELLRDAEQCSLGDYCQPFPGKQEMAGLRQFFSEYPAFESCNIGQFCEFFGYSEKKLSHICPEVSKFKKTVVKNRNFFEALHSLEQTSFLAVDDEDEKAMDECAKRIEGAAGLIARIKELARQKHSNREEYEKSIRIEKRKKELSGHSAADLKAQLAETRRLLELLHSPLLPDGDAEETDCGKTGLLSGFGSFLKKISGDS
jgi:hypothetical protein